MASIVASFLKINATTIVQNLTPSKSEAKYLSGLIRDNTKRYWKPIAGAVVVGTCVYGAIKIRSEILLAREEFKFAPTALEVENLSVNASVPEVGASLDEGLLGQLDELKEALLDCEAELEECLEVDDVFKDQNEKNVDIEQVAAIAECKDETVKKAMIDKHDAELVRKSRKRVRKMYLPLACKAMVAKIRASFPIPDGTALQQKAMSLYLAKEGRKLKMRESQLAVLIPRAVALASVPSDAQIDMRILMAIEPVKFKYQKMKWGGVVNEKSWLSRLVSSLPNIQ